MHGGGAGGGRVSPLPHHRGPASTPRQGVHPRGCAPSPASSRPEPPHSGGRDPEQPWRMTTRGSRRSYGGEGRRFRDLPKVGIPNGAGPGRPRSGVCWVWRVASPGAGSCRVPGPSGWGSGPQPTLLALGAGQLLRDNQVHGAGTEGCWLPPASPECVVA